MGLFSSILGSISPVLGSVLGASSNKKAIKGAAAAQTDALNRAIALGNEQFQTTNANLTPYRDAGVQALGQQSDLLGLNGMNEQDAAISGLQGSPLFQSLFGQGQDAILASASATGGLRGGNVQGSLANFGRDTLAQVIMQQLQGLSGLSGQGLGAATQTGQFGAANAANAGGLTTQIGNTQAGSILNRQAIDNNLQAQLTKLISSAATGGFGGGLAGIGGGSIAF